MGAALRIDSRVSRGAVSASRIPRLPVSFLRAGDVPDSVLLIVVYVTATWTPFPGALRWSIKATNAEIVAATGLSARTVERAMRWLREHHMLRETVAMPGHSPKRYLVFPSAPYVQIPAQLAARARTAPRLRLLAYILRKRIGRPGDVGWCELRRERIAANLGMHPATVSRLVAELEADGVLTVKLRRERGAPWALQIPSAPPITQAPCAAVSKRLDVAQGRATPPLPALVRASVSVSSRRGFESPDDGRAELRKRGSTRARVRLRASSSSPPTEEKEHLEELVVTASCEPQVVTGRALSALRAAPRDVGAVIGALPAPLRVGLPPTLPRRVVALVEKGLRARTVGQLVERARRRWVGGGYAGQELRDPVGVVVSLLVSRCGDERCEDGRIVDAEGFDYPCDSCGVWGRAEGAPRVTGSLRGVVGADRPARELWRPRGPLHDWRAELRAVVAVPRPAHLDWRQHADRRT